MPVTPAIEASLIEVFSSIQGEGVLIGCRQLFVRFAQCNLTCNYCDTSFQAGPTCRIESEPGTGRFEAHVNPVNLVKLTRQLVSWQDSCNNVHHSLALTGGEPLLHADILKAWLPDVLPVLPVFLETNGTLPDELSKILPLLNFISMDIKGASTSGAPTPWDEHAEFLKLSGGRLCQVKLVVDSGTPRDQLLSAARLVNRHAPDVPLILQPRTLAAGPALDGATLLRMQTLAAAEHTDVRIIPQIHPWLGVA